MTTVSAKIPRTCHHPQPVRPMASILRADPAPAPKRQAVTRSSMLRCRGSSMTCSTSCTPPRHRPCRRRSTCSCGWSSSTCPVEKTDPRVFVNPGSLESRAARKNGRGAACRCRASYETVRRADWVRVRARSCGQPLRAGMSGLLAVCIQQHGLHDHLDGKLFVVTAITEARPHPAQAGKGSPHRS